MTEDVRTLDPTSVEAWKQRGVTIPLTGDVAVKIRMYDILALLSDDGDIPNPLLAVAQRRMKPGADEADEDEAGRALMSDPKAVDALRGALNRIMIAVVIAPPLVEQGHADGVSVDAFSLEDKMIIFNELSGGDERLDAAARFPDAQTSRVRPAPAGESLRAPAQPDAVPG